MQMKSVYLLRRTAALVAGFVAASTFALVLQADTSIFTPTALNLPVDYPQVWFDGSNSSRIAYDPGTRLLTVDAGSFALATQNGGTVGQDATHFGGILAAGATAYSFGTFKIRGVVDSNGSLVSGIAPGSGNDACGDGNGDDFCVIGEVDSFTLNPDNTILSKTVLFGPGVLLKGEVVAFAFDNDRPEADANHCLFGETAPCAVDDFVFHIRVTGGALNAAGYYPTGYVAVWDRSPKFIHVTPDVLPYANPFRPRFIDNVGVIRGGFTETFSVIAHGESGPTSMPTGALQPCNGQIGNFVWNDLNYDGIQNPGEPGIEGAAVTLSHVGEGYPVLSTVTNAGGFYFIPNVCPGDNKIDVSTEQWYSPSPSNHGDPLLDSDLSGVVVTVGTGEVKFSVDFGFYRTPVVSSAYTTYTEGGWGSKPFGNNAGKILADYFDLLYPNPDGELVVGIPNTPGRFTVTLTGASAVQTFLPQSGKPAALDRDYVDPPSWWKLKHRGKTKHHRMISELAGNVVALKLNVDFSAASLTRYGLGGLHVATGKLAGMTVNQVLALGNNVLGAAPGLLPTGVTIAQLNEVIESINANYQAGGRDRHYLIP